MLQSGRKVVIDFMSDLTLVIGNRNYSSWSLRAWLVLRAAGLKFTEVRLPLYTDRYRAEIKHYSPSGKVPVLIHGDTAVWDSLAIAEYIHELAPDMGLWPSDLGARARARSICAEIHSGFPEIKHHLPMNCRGRFIGKGHTEGVKREVVRVAAIWDETRSRYGGSGEFLFGSFGIADAMYAPLALRFQSYGISLSGEVAQYAASLLELPLIKSWSDQAREEEEVIEEVEIYR